MCSMNSGGVGRAINFVHRRLQCRRDIRIRGFVESHVAVADLDEAQFACDRFGSDFEISLRLYDFSTPPCITQNAPVPAHAMHFKNPRRSIPSLL